MGEDATKAKVGDYKPQKTAMFSKCVRVVGDVSADRFLAKRAKPTWTWQFQKMAQKGGHRRKKRKKVFGVPPCLTLFFKKWDPSKTPHKFNI